MLPGWNLLWDPDRCNRWELQIKWDPRYLESILRIKNWLEWGASRGRKLSRSTRICLSTVNEGRSWEEAVTVACKAGVKIRDLEREERWESHYLKFASLFWELPCFSFRCCLWVPREGILELGSCSTGQRSLWFLRECLLKLGIGIKAINVRKKVWRGNLWDSLDMRVAGEESLQKVVYSEPGSRQGGYWIWRMVVTVEIVHLPYL